MQGDLCLDCGAPLGGRYCAACGQKRIEPAERRLAWFFRELAASAFGADGRLRRTLASFALRPGELGADWLAGRRTRHLSPLALFLLVNLVYFVAPRLTDLALPLGAQFMQFYGEQARALVDARLAARGIALEAYAPEFELQVHSLAKLLVILHPLLLAPVLALLLWRRRIPLVDHLAVALHLWAGILAIGMALPWVAGAVYELVGVEPRAAPLWWKLALALLVSSFVALTLRRGYRLTPAWVALALPAVFVGVAVGHLLVYRPLLFLLAFALS